MHVVVMGVSSCGKSTVGALLGYELGVPFKDGDELHPPSNIEKMSAGIPLTDDDRWSWLDAIGEWLAAHPSGGVIACSALKRSYRDTIRRHAPNTLFIHLHGSHELMAARMAARPGHFMPPSLLASQFATLQHLEPDERGRFFDVAHKPVTIAHEAAAWLRALPIEDQ
ncbi:gluconokinase [Corynebacterium uropygiale]|uniref:Gluconokinase n=1 Tax=Corynebacterium uropygiale TaxID=1775911 RepID=A0A9X1QRJ4_9CORY|nr:gluconokinase [Corynebacterium uropygiale]MCF4007441.1 gluconokinase [Corynebacterium uropygiale]